MTLYLHSLAILLNAFSMTALMVLCGLYGDLELTADIAVVQGSTLTLFFAFSANVRNVIFADQSGSAPHLHLRIRLFLLVPLAVLSFILSYSIGSVNAAVAIVLIARRCSEWIGEVFLSSYEVQNIRRPVFFTITAEVATFISVIAMLFVLGIDPAVAMALWALAPLVAVFAGRLKRLQAPIRLRKNLEKLTPNFGSTTIIGISVYVFRLSIILLLGRLAAGELFTAFAIGGLLPTIYSSSVGPSVVLREHRSGIKEKISKNIMSFATGVFLFGVVITSISLLYPQYATLFNKAAHFWTATGISVSGGAIMFFALRVRIRMLQEGRNFEIFGADAISNVLIIISVPYFYYLLGVRSFDFLYLFSSILTICFYWSAHCANRLEIKVWPNISRLLFFIGGLVVLPLFVQFSGGVFREALFTFDTGGLLKLLPIPVSVIALAVGILSLGKFRSAHRSLIVFFFMSVLAVVTSLFVQTQNNQMDRLILMGQYLLPVLGLVLGEMYGNESKNEEFEKVCLVIVGVIVPMQLICSWLQGMTVLTPYLYFFSIYQHEQYVPLIIVLAYGLAFGALWNNNRRWQITIFSILPWIAIYSVASRSKMAIATLFGFIICIMLVVKQPVAFRRMAIGMVVLTLFAGISYGMMTKTLPFSHLIENADRNRHLTSVFSSSKSLTDRYEHWKYFGLGVFDSTKIFFLGHPTPPDRRVHPSAHNYYLDFIYNLGFLPLIPLLSLLAYAFWYACRLKSLILSDLSLFTLISSVFILFALDNMLKVGLRQPYPGIFSFFLLGFYLARFDRTFNNQKIRQ